MTLNKSSIFWIFWGGRGRSQSIEALLSSGYTNLRVYAAESLRKNLQSEADKLSKEIEIRWIKRSDLNKMKVESQVNLISIGFPYLFHKNFLRQFHTALNLHPTLLPSYRGPHSGFYIIANGETESGSTLHIIDDGVDTGPIISQSIVTLNDFDSVRTMQLKVYAQESQTLLNGLQSLADTNFSPRKQDNSQATTYEKIRTPDDSEINGNKSLHDLYNTIRACDPFNYPAFFYRNGKKIYVQVSPRPFASKEGNR